MLTVLSFVHWHNSTARIRLFVQVLFWFYTTTCLRSALFWDITQLIVVILETFRYNISVPFSRVKKSERLKKGPLGCPETSVKNYHCTLRNIPEERTSYILRGGSLKSRILPTYLPTYIRITYVCTYLPIHPSSYYLSTYLSPSLPPPSLPST